MALNTNFFVAPVNLDRVCRVCLLEGANLSPIFSAAQEPNDFSGLPQKIQVCGSIEIHENDGFPSLICSVCIYKASVAHEFRVQCQQSDTRLRLLYDKPVTSVIAESGTQTKLQPRIILTRKLPTPPLTYFVKEELQQATQPDYVAAIEAYTENHVEPVRTEHTMDCHEEKMFLCNIDYDESKMEDKETSIMSHEGHRVACSRNHEDQLQPSLIDVNTNDHLNQREIMTKVDTPIKCNETEMEDEYLNEQLLNDTVDNSVDQEHVELQEHPPEDEEQPQPTRTLRQSKPPSGRCYTENDDDNNYFGDEEPQFQCDACSRRFATQNGLRSHIQVHDKKYKCPICHKLFYKIRNMEKHRRIHQSKPHACQLCHTSFSKPKALSRHLKAHADKVNDVMIQTKTDEERKENENDDKTKLNVETDDENGPNDDVDEQSQGLYKCQICGQFCSSMKNLKRHGLVHGDKKYSCTVCKKWFFRPDTLKKHAEKHGHGLLDNLTDDNKLFDSDDDTFENSNVAVASLNDGIKRDESDDDTGGEYKCQHCDKIMATKKGLRRHVSLHKPKAEPVSCEICKKICASQARLALHLKTHNKPKEKVQREYLCHICSKVYPSNSSLTYHMRTHTGIKPHVCKICNSGFTTTTSLANHIRIHTGDKPYVCHVCSAAFAVSSAFRRHLTRHTGEANYLCKTCGKAFKRLSTLKEHTYTHSGEKPYVCKTCGAAYSHSGSLFAHQKRCRVQYGEMIEEHTVGHHIHVSDVQTAVRSLAVIGQMY